jgi:outer membrane protein assembly factor BamB
MKRFRFPIILTLVVLLAILWFFITEHFLRVGIIYLGIIIWILGLFIWWVGFSGGGFRWRSLLIGLGMAALLVVAVPRIVRFDGSSTGANPFRLAWRWTPLAYQQLSKPEPKSSDLSPTLDGLADFPGFLGPNRDGLVNDPGLETDWVKNPPQELWRIQVGAGWSAFAVSGMRAVTQEQRSDDECVTCYDVGTGKLLWSHSDPARFDDPMGGPGPRSTPTIEGNMVYTFGGTGVLNALDLETGNRQWSVEVLAGGKIPNAVWGVSASPLVTQAHVIVLAGEKPGVDQLDQALYAYDKITGELKWSYGPADASYSSPRLMTLGGREQLVAVIGQAAIGLEPATGQLIWRFEWPGVTPKPGQPVKVSDTEVLVTCSYGIPSHLLKIEGSTATPVWSAVEMKTKFSSALVKDGYAYGLDEGKMICIDLKSGKRLWKGGRYGYGQNLLLNDLILIQSEKGDVVLCRTNPAKLEELAVHKVFTAKTWNAPALAGRYLLVRNDQEAVCLKLPIRQP